MSAAYQFSEIEPRWQKRWEEEGLFRAAGPGEPGSERPKYYVLDFFPYPSGAGLHIGHPLGYTATDIIARYKRMRGYNVLHPMGWDAFGLPAEQFAIETGVHPSVTTRRNIDTFRRQLKSIGFSFDWRRELATCDPGYYRWTQWIFLQIYNAWYDPEHRWTDADGREVVGRARPIATLPIPAEVRAAGMRAVEQFQADHRLAYLAEVPVNWCPALGTVLANEEVTSEGRSERGDHPVYRRPMKQWMLRITEYADRLLSDLDALDWPEAIKLQQRNWIGRSEGAYVDFRLERANGAESVIRVFTTRPDTLYGATYMVLAPEHRLTPIITTPEQRALVMAYVDKARQKSELDRTAAVKTKTGVFTGAYAVNPVNRKRIPIWVADYVLLGYGTGSIMAVPGHDTRDLEFAEAFGLPVVKVVEAPAGTDWRGFVGEGVACNSPPEGERFEGQCDFNHLRTPAAKQRIIEWLEENGLGEGTVQYKLRDWLFSRQRYWGEPFPILHTADGRIVAEEEAALPVTLPAMDDFRPLATSDPNAEPQTPLSRAGEWASVVRDGERLTRELNTMPQWAGSCWYYLRFCDPGNDRVFVDPGAERYWMGGRSADGSPRIGGVDLYLGGAEHAVLHLLYARFWHKVLYDLGQVSTPEPFHRLFNQGMIRSYAYRDARGVYIGYDEIDFREEGAFLRSTGEPLAASVEKMSKTLRNVVTPDSIIAQYGADTLRLYEMFMGPLEASKPWDSRNIIGCHKFLHRVWRLVVDGEGGGVSARVTAERNESLERPLHRTIKKVTGDIETFGFNTAIAMMMEFVNEAYRAATIGRDQVERFLLVLAPFAPHMSEELWQRLGHESSLAWEAWPEWDEALAREETVELLIKVLNKDLDRIRIPAAATDEEIVAAVLSHETVRTALGGRALRKPPVIGRSQKGPLVNLIV